MRNQNLPPFVPPSPVVPVPGGNPDADDFQKANTGRAPVDASRHPQSAIIGANDVQFQPTPADIIGDMSHSPVLDRQAIDVRASGDMVAGGSGDGVERRPTIRGLP